MAIYDTAATIINDAAVASSQSISAAPYSDPSTTMREFCSLLNRCGRQLLIAYQWQQLIKTHSFNTGAVPPTDGEYDLPADFGWMINQTGWTPSSGGLGLPLGGPISEQIWAMLVASGLGAGTIYASFKISDGVMKFLTPVPADQDVTYSYMSQGWVDVHGSGTDFATIVENDDDVVMFDSELIKAMLELRWKQAKGLDWSTAGDAFATAFQSFTGINTPAPVLSAAYVPRFPLLGIQNVPQTGYGS